MNRFWIMCVAPFRSFTFFTESDYVSICAVMYIPSLKNQTLVVNFFLRRQSFSESYNRVWDLSGGPTENCL
jgi:hypothetical protein